MAEDQDRVLASAAANIQEARGILSAQTVADVGFILYLYFSFVGLTPFQGYTQTIFVTTGDPDTRLQFALILSALMVIGPSFQKSLPRPSLFLVLASIVFAWCLTTIAWSAVPAIGFRRLILTVLSFVVIATYIRRSGPQHAMRMLRVFLGATVVISVLSSLFIPGALQPPDGSESGPVRLWRGVFYHRNLAGLVSAFATLYFLMDNKPWEVKKISIIALSTILVLASFSKTSMIALLVALILAPITYMIRNMTNRTMTIVLLALGAIVVASLIAQMPNTIQSLFSDPSGFTGRVELWTALVKVAGNAGWLKGAGFGSLFDVGSQTPLAPYMEGWLLQATHGHNGYLQLVASVGIPGLLLALATFFILPFWRLLDTAEPQIPRLQYISLLLFLAVHNLAESSLLDRNRIGWILLIAIAAAIDAQYRPYLAEQRSDDNVALQAPPDEPTEPSHFT